MTVAVTGWPVRATAVVVRGGEEIGPVVVLVVLVPAASGSGNRGRSSPGAVARVKTFVGRLPASRSRATTRPAACSATTATARGATPRRRPGRTASTAGDSPTALNAPCRALSLCAAHSGRSNTFLPSRHGLGRRQDDDRRERRRLPRRGPIAWPLFPWSHGAPAETSGFAGAKGRPLTPGPSGATPPPGTRGVTPAGCHASQASGTVKPARRTRWAWRATASRKRRARTTRGDAVEVKAMLRPSGVVRAR